MKKVAIVTVNYNSDKTTLDLLKQLYYLPGDFEYFLYVVDNSSGSSREIEEFIADNQKYSTKLLKSEKNLGFAGGCNLAIKEAFNENIDYILVLNNDVIVNKSFVTDLVTFAEHKGPCFVSPKIYFAKGHEFHKRYKEEELGYVLWYAGGVMDWKNVLASHRGVDEVDRGQYDKNEETDFVSGCCMLLSASALKNTGFFNEDYFLYYEDVDLSMRAKKREYKTYYCHEAKIWHKNAASGGGSGSQLQDYYISRNRMIFGMTYAPLRSKLSLIKESLGILSRGREWQKKAIADFYLQKLGKGSFPLA